MHPWFLPGRVFDVRDILFNVLAAIMAVAASATLRWARRKRRDKLNRSQNRGLTALNLKGNTGLTR